MNKKLLLSIVFALSLVGCKSNNINSEASEDSFSSETSVSSESTSSESSSSEISSEETTSISSSTIENGERDGSSIEKALTTKEAVELMKQAGDGKVVPGEKYVRGVFATGTTVNTKYHEWYGYDGDFKVSGAKTASGITVDEKDGALDKKEFVVKGYLELYQGEYKCGYLPASVSPTGQKYTPSLVYIGETGSSGETSENETSSYEITSNLESYYSNVDQTSPSKLADSLQTLMFKTHTTWTSYDSLKTELPKSDKDPNGSNKTVCFISHELFNSAWDGGKTWNREHVWPKSRSGGAYENSKGGADMHHIRPTLTEKNSDHGSASYGSFENPDCSKGDIARICMYMFVHYSNTLHGNNVKSDYMGNMRLTNVFTSLSLIKEWNAQDPVDIYETNRNEYCYSVQGNRNPFIDHPEWVNIIVDSYL